MNKILKWLIIIASAFLLGNVIAQLTQQYLIPTKGNVKAVDVKITWLENGTEVTNINWGAIENGTVTALPSLINVTNINNTDVTLSLTTQDWSATIQTLTLTWNYTDTILKPNDLVIVQLTQTIIATDDWSYTTVITANEAT